MTTEPDTEPTADELAFGHFINRAKKMFVEVNLDAASDADAPALAILERLLGTGFLTGALWIIRTLEAEDARGRHMTIEIAAGWANKFEAWVREQRKAAPPADSLPDRPSTRPHASEEIEQGRPATPGAPPSEATRPGETP